MTVYVCAPLKQWRQPQKLQRRYIVNALGGTLPNGHAQLIVARHALGEHTGGASVCSKGEHVRRSADAGA